MRVFLKYEEKGSEANRFEQDEKYIACSRQFSFGESIDGLI